MSDAEPKIDLAAWLDDTAAAFELQQKWEESRDRYPLAFAEYFQDRYPDPAQRDYHQRRVAAALNWLECHVDEVETAVPDDTIAGREGALLSKHLLVALWSIYANCPDDSVETDFPVELIADQVRLVRNA